MSLFQRVHVLDLHKELWFFFLTISLFRLAMLLYHWVGYRREEHLWHHRPGNQCWYETALLHSRQCGGSHWRVVSRVTGVGHRDRCQSGYATMSLPTLSRWESVRGPGSICGMERFINRLHVCSCVASKLCVAPLNSGHPPRRFCKKDCVFCFKKDG